MTSPSNTIQHEQLQLRRNVLWRTLVWVQYSNAPTLRRSDSPTLRRKKRWEAQPGPFTKNRKTHEWTYFKRENKEKQRKTKKNKEKNKNQGKKRKEKRKQEEQPKQIASERLTLGAGGKKRTTWCPHITTNWPIYNSAWHGGGLHTQGDGSCY